MTMIKKLIKKASSKMAPASILTKLKL